MPWVTSNNDKMPNCSQNKNQSGDPRFVWIPFEVHIHMHRRDLPHYTGNRPRIKAGYRMMGVDWTLDNLDRGSGREAQGPREYPPPHTGQAAERP